MFQHFYRHFREDILHLEHYYWTTLGSTSVWTFSSTCAKIKKGQVQIELQTYTPPIDDYTTGIQTRPTLLLDDDSPLLTPKEVYKPTKQLKSLADTTSEGETLISQVMPLLGTTPSKKIVKLNIGIHQMIFQIYWAQESTKGMLKLHYKH